MKKVRFITTGIVKEVSNNEAFDLIDSRQAELYHTGQLSQGSKITESEKPIYQDRQMRPSIKSK
mgnify:CR=1 FL=1